jgi:hypothetical protein
MQRFVFVYVNFERILRVRRGREHQKG